MRAFQLRLRSQRGAVALAVLLLAAAACEPAPPPGTSHSPSGAVDQAFIWHGTWVQGWAADWDSPDPVRVMFFVMQPVLRPDGSVATVSGWRQATTCFDGSFGSPICTETGFALLADLPRPDVDAVFHRGADVGYSVRMDLVHGVDDRAGRYHPAAVCVVALNLGPGDHTILGCRSL